jgi:S-(hydroxymethyl)glutathione dehydrogenase/alcohol dehydrogenase
MKTVAAVLVETCQPLVLAELELPSLKAGQILVEIAYSSACHTQLLEMNGHRGKDPYLPHCLGHEAAGTVVEIGQGVHKVKVGDAIVLSWMKGSGADVSGSVYRWGDRNVNSGAVTTFSRYSVVSENRVTRIGDGISSRDAALVGCTLATGLGSVLNTARAKPGDSVAVFGCGGVGLCAVGGAAVAGCAPIIAIDMNERKLGQARQMGATHTILIGTGEEIPSGLDFAIEATGRPDVMLQALACVRNQGGTAVIVGNARYGEVLHLDPTQLNLGKRLLGTWGGDNKPDADFQRYAKLLASGKINLQPIISRTYAFEDINAALNDLATGKIVRPLIKMWKSA